MVLTLNQSSYARHSILLKDMHTFLDEAGIGLQMEFLGQRPPLPHHSILGIEDYCILIKQYPVVAMCTNLK